MSPSFSYRHLYYFWVVAKEGGVARAAARLGMAVQTVSAQVRELERSLGHALLKPAGRGVALTEAGLAAMRQGDQIFALGDELPALVRDAAASPTLRLRAGISDALPKLVVRRLMEPVMHETALRLLCHVDEFDDLLADLALHRLDVVLADRPATSRANLRLYSHSLGVSGMSWYAPPSLAAAGRRGFPRSLSQLPVLLPSAHAAVRVQLDQWFERHALRPRIVGEFEDSALLKTFGASGMGVFPAPDVVHDDLVERYHVKRLGPCDGVEEQFYAIGTEKKVQHPLVRRLLPGFAHVSVKLALLAFAGNGNTGQSLRRGSAQRRRQIEPRQGAVGTRLAPGGFGLSHHARAARAGAAWPRILVHRRARIQGHGGPRRVLRVGAGSTASSTAPPAWPSRTGWRAAKTWCSRSTGKARCRSSACSSTRC